MFEVQSKFAVYLPVASVSFCTGHHFGAKDVFDVSMVYNNIVYEVPVFGSWTYPGCFKTDLLLEDGVDDDKLWLSAKPPTP